MEKVNIPKGKAISVHQDMIEQHLLSFAGESSNELETWHFVGCSYQRPFSQRQYAILTSCLWQLCSCDGMYGIQCDLWNKNWFLILEMKERHTPSSPFVWKKDKQTTSEESTHNSETHLASRLMSLTWHPQRNLCHRLSEMLLTPTGCRILSLGKLWSQSKLGQHTLVNKISDETK